MTDDSRELRHSVYYQLGWSDDKSLRDIFEEYGLDEICKLVFQATMKKAAEWIWEQKVVPGFCEYKISEIDLGILRSGHIPIKVTGRIRNDEPG